MRAKSEEVQKRVLGQRMQVNKKQADKIDSNRCNMLTRNDDKGAKLVVKPKFEFAIKLVKMH